MTPRAATPLERCPDCEGTGKELNPRPSRKIVSCFACLGTGKKLGVDHAPILIDRSVLEMARDYLVACCRGDYEETADCGETVDFITRALTENTRAPSAPLVGELREALEKYGRHLSTCEKTFADDRNQCTCGFKNAVTGAKERR